jgi:hypothetical protein
LTLCAQHLAQVPNEGQVDFKKQIASALVLGGLFAEKCPTPFFLTLEHDEPEDLKVARLNVALLKRARVVVRYRDAMVLLWKNHKSGQVRTHVIEQYLGRRLQRFVLQTFLKSISVEDRESSTGQARKPSTYENRKVLGGKCDLMTTVAVAFLNLAADPDSYEVKDLISEIQNHMSDIAKLAS